MSAAVVAGASFGDGLDFVVHQGVGEGGFADAGGADERGGGAWRDEGFDGVHTESVERIGENNRDVGGDGIDFVAKRRGVVDEVDFGEDDDGLSAAVEYSSHVAFEPSQVQFEIEGCDDENDVEVCADDLHGGALAGGLANELAAARERFDDVGEVVFEDVDADPVADGGGGFGVVAVGALSAADFCSEGALRRENLVLDAVIG